LIKHLIKHLIQIRQNNIIFKNALCLDPLSTFREHTHTHTHTHTPKERDRELTRCTPCTYVSLCKLRWVFFRWAPWWVK